MQLRVTRLLVSFHACLVPIYQDSGRLSRQPMIMIRNPHAQMRKNKIKITRATQSLKNTIIAWKNRRLYRWTITPFFSERLCSRYRKQSLSPVDKGVRTRSVLHLTWCCLCGVGAPYFNRMREGMHCGGFVLKIRGLYLAFARAVIEFWWRLLHTSGVIFWTFLIL